MPRSKDLRNTNSPETTSEFLNDKVEDISTLENGESLTDRIK